MWFGQLQDYVDGQHNELQLLPITFHNPKSHTHNIHKPFKYKQNFSQSQTNSQISHI